MAPRPTKPIRCIIPSRVAIFHRPLFLPALTREIGLGRLMAYVYWITIASVCFLGATKPF